MIKKIKKKPLDSYQLQNGYVTLDVEPGFAHGTAFLRYGIVKLWAWPLLINRECVKAVNVERALAGEELVKDWEVSADFIYEGRIYRQKWNYLKRMPTPRGLAVLLGKWQRQLLKEIGA